MKDIHKNSTDSYTDYKKDGKQNSFRSKIWDLIKETGRPMTDREVMNILNELDVNNIRPEITRLKQDGLLIETGKIKCPITNKKVRTTTITPLPYFNRIQK